MTQQIKLVAIDDFILADWGIDPAWITNQSSHMGFGIERRSGIYGSVFFGASAVPAVWNVLIACKGSEAARQALISVLAGQRDDPFRLLAQRLIGGDELVTIEASVSGEIEEEVRGNIRVNFESNDSIWLAEDSSSAAKTFVSPLDQTMHLNVLGNVPTHPVLRLTPQAQREVPTPYVGWTKRERWVISNEGTDPLFRYEVMIDLGNTAALVAAEKARADGADLRVWLHGLEQARTLVDWNTTSTKLWVIVPILPPRQSLTYDVVYGNPAATSADGVELVYPEMPAYDIEVSTNLVHVYRNGRDIEHASEGLWPLSSALEGGSADYGAPGAWQPALTFENPNNSDTYVQPRSQRMTDGDKEWYQANLYASRWRGDGFEQFRAYEGADPYDGVTLYNPFGVRSVHTDGFIWLNSAKKKKVVTTTVDETTESTEVDIKQDPPYTRVVAIGRNSGGEGWHVLQEYGATSGDISLDDEEEGTGTRLFLPGSGRPTIYPPFAIHAVNGWYWVGAGYRFLATRNQQFTQPFYATVTGDSGGNVNLMSAQFIYPLPAGVEFKTSDTVKAQIGASYQNASARNARAQMCIRVMTADGVERARLLDFDNTTAITTNKYIQWWDTNRRFPSGGEDNLQANYTTVAGDYLVMEFGSRSTGSPISTRLVFEDRFSNFLSEVDAVDGSEQGNPWIEFSTNLSATDLTIEQSVETFPTTWTPPSPVKHFGIACWPQGAGQIPDDIESRAWATTTEDIIVHVAAEQLFITKVEAETEIYELASEFRLPGGANAVGPYHALLVGNAREMSGPGTPRAAIKLGDQAVQIDTERRTHTVWDADFTVQEEAISTHAVRALVGGLRQVDATDIPSLSRRSIEIPNDDFASSTSQWEELSGGSGWTKTVTHDPDVGGAGLGSMKMEVTSAPTPGTWLYRYDDLIAVDSDENVEVTAWMQQSEAGASSPRIGVAWYDNTPTLLATTLDQFYGINLDPAQGRTMIMSAPVYPGATQARIVVGVTIESDLPATKWFDDVTMAIYKPQHYDASLAKITEEIRASRWLPLVPPRRTVINGGFDADAGGWFVYDSGTGITHAAEHDAAVGGAQDGSLKIEVTANSSNDSAIYLNAQAFGVNGQESETLGAWVKTDNADIIPRLCIAWYTDPEGDPETVAVEAAWVPVADEEYNRAFGAVVPPEAEWFRVGVYVETQDSATGAVWIDDVRLNDNDLFFSDVGGGGTDLEVIVRPRWVP